jgi:Protein of unknown function (DUF4232)
MFRLLLFSPRLARWAATGFAAAAASAGALVAASSPAGAAGAPGCQTGGLVIWLDTTGNGSLGHIDYNLRFTNQSGRRCTLRGFPGVSAVGLSGRQLGKPASRDHSRRVKTITIPNGKTAYTDLRIVDNGALPNCSMVAAAGLRVFPPNGHSSKTVPFPFGACRNTSVLTVQAVRFGFGPQP